MREIEVRCCCTPQKLRGWLRVSDHMVQVGRRVFFPLAEATRTFRVGSVDLEVAIFWDGHQHYPALKNEGMPMETLRRIPGFRENLGES